LTILFAKSCSKLHFGQKIYVFTHLRKSRFYFSRIFAIGSEECVGKMQSLKQKDLAYLRMSCGTAESKQFRKAEEYTAQIKDHNRKDGAYLTIAEEKAKGGYFPEAKKSAAQIQGQEMRDEAYSKMAQAAAEHACFKEAQEFMAQISDEGEDDNRVLKQSTTDKVYSKMAIATAKKAIAAKQREWVEREWFEETREFVAQIQDQNQKDSTYFEMARAAARGKYFKEAAACAAQIQYQGERDLAYTLVVNQVIKDEDSWQDNVDWLQQFGWEKVLNIAIKTRHKELAAFCLGKLPKEQRPEQIRKMLWRVTGGVTDLTEVTLATLHHVSNRQQLPAAAAAAAAAARQ
jgi:hypothetical protein